MSYKKKVPWEGSYAYHLQCPVKESGLYSAWHHGGFLSLVMREQESQRQTAGHFLEAGKTCFQGKLHWKVRASSQGCHEHRPPVQTLVLGLCEGQGMLHSHKIMLLPHGFSFPKRKEKLVSTQGCVLRCGYPREIRAWGGLHGDAMLVQGEGAEPSHTCLSLHLGKLCIFQ